MCVGYGGVIKQGGPSKKHVVSGRLREDHNGDHVDDGGDGDNDDVKCLMQE